MDFHKFWKSNFAFVVLMFALAGVVGALVVFGTLYGLKNYTHHGEEIVVPNICGLYEAEADIILSEKGLHIQVVDSTYDNEAALGTIVEQTPKANSKAKRDRSIYVTVNARYHKTVPLPELKDMSQRQAEAILVAMKLKLGTIIYEPSEFRGLVLDVRNDSLHSIESGTRLLEGSTIHLVIGQGNGTEQVPVPNLIGKTLDEARKILLSSRLTLGAIHYHEGIPTNEDDLSSLYYVYQQYPERGEMIVEGSRIDISLSQEEDKIEESSQETEEEDFF